MPARVIVALALGLLATAAPAGAQEAQSRPTLLELAQPRAPYALGPQRGPGQLLFDMGVVADFVGNLAGGDAEEAAAGTFAGRENRFFPREVEVNLFGRIDPYAEGLVRFEFAEEFEEGERALEASLAEAHLTLLTLPWGTRLRLGRQPVQFGLLGHLHREALPQPDTPQVLLRFLGEEQFRDNGAELSWVAPTPFFLEAIAGVFDGDNEVAFGRGSLRAPLVNARLRAFFDFDEAGAIQLGLSAATGQTEEAQRNTLAGADVKYKLTPSGWRHPLLTLAGEGLWGSREVETDEGDDTRRRFGWYAYAEVQPWRRWAGGVRYDWTQLPADPGHEWAVAPYLAFRPSDFLRFRLAFKHTERSRREGFAADGPGPRRLDEVLFQATFYLGAHAPHPF